MSFFQYARSAEAVWTLRFVYSSLYDWSMRNLFSIFIDIYSYLFHLILLVLIYVEFTVAYAVNIKGQKVIARAQRASAAVYTSLSITLFHPNAMPELA